MRFLSPALSSRRPSKHLAHQDSSVRLVAKPSTETLEHHHGDVDKPFARTRKAQANTLGTIACLLRRESRTPGELSGKLTGLAEDSVDITNDADDASGLWLETPSAAPRR